MSESQQVEWKESWRDEYLKWVCGFANAQGGVLEIGRDNKGKAVGLSDSAKLMEDLPNKMRDTLGIIADVDRFEEDDKTLLRITVDPYPYPVSYMGEYHYRAGSTKQMLKPDFDSLRDIFGLIRRQEVEKSRVCPATWRKKPATWICA